MKHICFRCGTSCTLSRDSAANASTQVFWWCPFCNKYGTQKDHFIKHEVLTEKGITVSSLSPVKRPGFSYPRQCRKCKSLYTENHHWAPREVFGPECEEWPQDDLCVPCHNYWHDKIEAHYRHKFGNKANVNGNGKVNTYATEPTKA